MKNIIFLLVITIFASCGKEDVTPKSIWDKEFGPYNVLASKKVDVSSDINVPKREAVAATVFTADSNMTVHARSEFNISSDKGFSYWLALNGETIATNGSIGEGINGLRVLEVDGIQLNTGDKLECYIGYSDGSLIVKAGSYLWVEVY